ncbi:MAG: response regulator [Acidobacteriota bacterium]|nr:response regulator [Blastocatellia bacterium]MDW8411124.1 response regulator [Acidobacteriota bacterium]
MKRVLVVEDDLELAELIGMVVAEFEATVDIVDTAETALERLSNSVYDLVITDYHLSTVTGAQLMHSAVQLDCNYGNRFIFLTGETLARVASRSGIALDKFLVKPFRLEVLRRVLSGFLETRQPGPEEASSSGSPSNTPAC